MPTIRVIDFLSAHHSLFGDAVLVNRRQYAIPFNQRPFRWQNHHLDALWNDFLQAMQSGFDNQNQSTPWAERQALLGYPHFFGTFIFVQDSVGTYEVFDGQQRLTAVSMLAAILRELADEFSLKASGQVRQDLDSVKAQFSRWLTADPLGNEDRPRIIADGEFRPLFEALIVKHTDEAARDAAVSALPILWKERPDHARLRSGFKHLRGAVRSFLLAKGDAEATAFLLAAIKTLGHLFVCISTEITSEPFAYQVFQSLNGRGEPLSETDNIKNELFIRSRPQDHAAIASAWRSAVNAVGARDFGTFLRRRYLGIFGSPCRESELFRRVCAAELNVPKNGILTVVRTWEHDARSAQRLRTQAGFDPKTSYLLRVIFDTLSASMAEIILLPALRKIFPVSPADFRDIAQATASFVFRELTIGHKKTNSIEQKLSEVAVAINKGAAASKALSLLARGSSDLEFQKAFEAVVETRARVQYYVFFEIEARLANNQGTGLSPFPQSPQQHVEHILPRKLPKRASDWDVWKRRRSRHEKFINRLGNLMILEANINSKIKNRSFKEKQTGVWLSPAGRPTRKVGYLDSTLKLPRKLARVRTPSGWTEREIEDRQKVLARLALNVWRIA